MPLRTSASRLWGPRRERVCRVVGGKLWGCQLQNHVQSCRNYASLSIGAAAGDRADAKRLAVEKLCLAGLEQDEATASVRWLLRAALKAGPAWHAVFADGVERRALREPVQYILGSWPFHSLPRELLVRRPVLIPRPETEELVELIRSSYDGGSPPANILDIGCGTGAIAVALLHVFPCARALALDSSAFATELTIENAMRCGVDARLEVVCNDVESFARTAQPESFDLIVSNPPYIPSEELQSLQPEVRCYEAQSALDGGADGLDIVRSVMSCSRKVGKADARVFLELHHTHPASFAAQAEKGESHNLGFDKQLQFIRTDEDMFGHPRFAELRVN